MSIGDLSNNAGHLKSRTGQRTGPRLVNPHPPCCCSCSCSLLLLCCTPGTRELGRGRTNHARRRLCWRGDNAAHPSAWPSHSHAHIFRAADPVSRLVAKLATVRALQACPTAAVSLVRSTFFRRRGNGRRRRIGRLCLTLSSQLSSLRLDKSLFSLNSRRFAPGKGHSAPFIIGKLGTNRFRQVCKIDACPAAGEQHTDAVRKNAAD